MENLKKTILLTNIWLNNYAGSEINCLCLAKAMRAKGYNVEVATFKIGEPMSSEFARQNILVRNLLTEDLSRNHYDIIWAHHAAIADYVIFQKRITADKLILSSLSPFEPYEVLPAYANDVSLCLANSQETKQKLISEGTNGDKIYVFPNYVDQEWLQSATTCQYGVSPRKIAIVSNHVPEELLQAKAVLMERGCEVDVYGIGYKVALITPEILRQYDVVITIGKTVQYCMALQIPVYIYDIHGGPGYLAADELDTAAYYNFSGRGFKRKSAEFLVDDITEHYIQGVEILPESYIYICKTSVLDNNIQTVLSLIEKTEDLNFPAIWQKYGYIERNNKAMIRLMREKNDIEDLLADTSTERERILNSKSWKITKPLRTIMKVLHIWN